MSSQVVTAGVRPPIRTDASGRPRVAASSDNIRTTPIAVDCGWSGCFSCWGWFMFHVLSSRSWAKPGAQQNDVRRQVRNGVLTTIKRGWYFDGVPTASPTDQHRLSSWRPRVTGSKHRGEPRVCCGADGLPVPNSSSDGFVTRRGGGHGGRTDGLRVSQSSLPDDDVGVLSGVRVTTLERTALDVARTVPFEWGVAVMDALLRRSGGMAARDSLTERLARESKRKGNPRARMAAEFADPRAESPGESISRVVFARHGLPKPTLQLEVVSNGRLVGISDFAWEEQRTLGDLTVRSSTPGRSRQAPARPRRSSRRSHANRGCETRGWWFVRWGWADLRDEVALVARVRRAF